MGKGALPDDHPFTLGMTGFWGTEFINDYCRNADVILALGTRFCEADCSSWDPDYTFNFPPTRLIHIDIDPSEIGRNYPVEIGAIADLKQALIALNRVAKKLLPNGRKNEALLRKEIAAYRAEFKKATSAAEIDDAFPMRPERILADVRAVLPRDAIITTDVGWNKNGVGQQFPGLYARFGSHARAVTPPWALARLRRSAPRSPARKGSWCRWSAMAASARTQRCCHRL